MNNNSNNFDTLSSTNNVNNTNVGNSSGAFGTNMTVNNGQNMGVGTTSSNTPINVAINNNGSSQVNVPINNNTAPIYNQNNTEILEASNSNSSTVNNSNNNTDVNYVYTPPSKFKYFLLILFFFVLLGMIIFLPELTQFVNLKLSGGSNQPEVIVDGTLECTLKKTGTNLDTVFNAKFNFTDQKLDKLTFTTTTKGDSEQDSEVFNSSYNKCQLLKDSMTDISGVSIRCDLESSSVSTVEIVNYNTVDLTKATSAFAEAGGVFPEFESSEDISKIEREMNASGYTCNKYK